MNFEFYHLCRFGPFKIVAFRAGEVEPDAGDAILNGRKRPLYVASLSRDERANVTEGRPEQNVRGCRVKFARWSRRHAPND